MRFAPRMILATVVALAVTHAQFSTGRAAGPPGGGGGGDEEEPWSLFLPGHGEYYSQHPGYIGGGPVPGSAGLYNFQHGSSNPNGVFMSELTLLTYDGITVTDGSTWVRPPETEVGSLFTMLVDSDLGFQFPFANPEGFPGAEDNVNLLSHCEYWGVPCALYFVEAQY